MQGPGWYLDPSGLYDVRFWDGQAWTARVSTNQQTSTSDVEDWPAPTGEPQRLETVGASRPPTRKGFFKKLRGG